MPKSPDVGPGRSALDANFPNPGVHPQRENSSSLSGRWQPDRHPVHRLIQLLDVIVIADNWGYQLLGMSPLAGMALHLRTPEMTDEWRHRRDEVFRDRSEIIDAIFSTDGVFAESEAQRLANEAIAHLREKGHTDPYEDVLGAAQVMLDFVVAPTVMDSEEWPILPGQNQPSRVVRDAQYRSSLPDQYSGARTGLLSCLARVGEIIPEEIHNRDRLGLFALPAPEWGPEDAANRLFGWAIQTFNESKLIDNYISISQIILNEIREIFKEWHIDPPRDATWGEDFRLPWWRRKVRMLGARVRVVDTSPRPTPAEWQRMIDGLSDALLRGARMIELPTSPPEPTPLRRRAASRKKGLPADEEMTAWVETTAIQIRELRDVKDSLSASRHPPLYYEDGLELKVLMSAVDRWSWPEPTGEEDDRYYELDIFLELADRVCTCVSMVAAVFTTNAPIGYPAGESLLRLLETRRHTVLGVDTGAHANMQEWRKMVAALADTLAAGLHLTSDDDCEAWRLRYVEHVSPIRGVRARLSPAGPFTKAVAHGRMRFMEQYGSFGRRAGGGSAGAGPEAEAEPERPVDAIGGREPAISPDERARTSESASNDDPGNETEVSAAGREERIDFSERRFERHGKALVKMLELRAMDGEFVIQANIVKAIEPQSVELGRVKGKWPVVFAALSRQGYTEGRAGGNDPGVTLTELGKAQAKRLSKSGSSAS